MEEERIPAWALLPSAVAAAGAVWLALEWPGSFAWWVSPLLALPLVIVATNLTLWPWDEAPRWRRVMAWAFGFACAAAGGAQAIAWPGDRSYLGAMLLMLPLFGVIVAWQGEHKERERGEPYDPTWDVPDF